MTNTQVAKQIFANHILLADGWAENVLMEIDGNGLISSIVKEQELPKNFVGDVIHGSIIPGMINNHSHAFQWAMAGLAEQSGAGNDSFWSWRKLMYDFVGKITPDDLEVIASALYMQMLKAGYTSVGEFHYLHHDLNGLHFSNQAEMSQRIFEAAKKVGINTTLLPVFYRYSGFGDLAPNEGQKRFIHNQDEYAELLNQVAQLANDYQQNFGIAPHSLRAVNQNDITFVINHLDSLNSKAPVHIHIAEQLKEVDDCLGHTGMRPVEWLAHQQELNSRWCLVHSTHMTKSEVQTVANSDAVVSICTTTEANLGDGFFEMKSYIESGGQWGVGSDSHISVSATEELRWLEYQNRLMSHSRTIFTAGDFSSNGHWLWTNAAKGGAQSLNNNAGELSLGKKADFIELNNDCMALIGATDNQLIDAFIFNQQASDNISSVWVKGGKVVSAGEHLKQDSIVSDYKRLLCKLLR